MKKHIDHFLKSDHEWRVIDAVGSSKHMAGTDQGATAKMLKESGRKV